MGISIGGQTEQLLCGGRIAASRQCQMWPWECCGAVALYGGENSIGGCWGRAGCSMSECNI